jgi:hypothetical protein
MKCTLVEVAVTDRYGSIGTYPPSDVHVANPVGCFDCGSDEMKFASEFRKLSSRSLYCASCSFVS